MNEFKTGDLITWIERDFLFIGYDPTDSELAWLRGINRQVSYQVSITKIKLKES